MLKSETVTRTSSASREPIARAPKEAPKPGPAHKRLEAFVGKWITEGQQHDGPFGPAARITAVETYEWLPGGFFVVHRLGGRMGDQEIGCIEIIGSDASSQTYSLHSFYNDGNRNEWQARERDGTWTYTGTWQMADESVKVRCTAVFNDSRTTIASKWEYSGDGSKWQPFWDVTATKAK